MPRISAVIRLTAISMEQKMWDASAKNTAQKARGQLLCLLDGTGGS